MLSERGKRIDRTINSGYRTRRTSRPWRVRPVGWQWVMCSAHRGGSQPNCAAFTTIVSTEASACRWTFVPWIIAAPCLRSGTCLGASVPPTQPANEPATPRAEAVSLRTGTPATEIYSPVLTQEGRLTDSSAAKPYYTPCDRLITLRDCMGMIWLVGAGRYKLEPGYACPECRLGLGIAFDPPVLMFPLLQLVLVEPYEP